MAQARTEQNKPKRITTELLRAALSGDKAASIDLAVLMAKLIYAIALRNAPRLGLGWRQEDYDDFCQDMLLALFKDDAKKLRGIKELRAFPKWLKVSVLLALIDRTRRKSHAQNKITDSLHAPQGQEGEEFTLEDILAGDSPTANDVVAHRELIHAVKDAIEIALSPEDKEILRLWGSRMYSLEEIGAIMDMNSDTVGVRINRAKHKILQHLRRQEGGV